MWVQIVQASPALWRVHWLRVCRLFGVSGPAKRLALVLLSCVPLVLSALSLCLWCVVFEYGPISRFKGVFSGFWAFRVGLVACVLCVACGAFVCVSG